MPTIHFPQTEPIYTPRTTVSFDVVIDGQQVRCEISEEAMEDHFGGKAGDAADLIRAFKASRGAIEAVGRVKLPARIAAGRGLLITQDF